MTRLGKELLILTWAILAHLSVNAPVEAQRKLAQTGFQFLSVGTDARAAGMGEALTTYSGSSMALFYNPAGLGRLESTIDLRASQMTWIADIKYFSATMGFRLAEGRYGVLGASLLSIDYGDLLGTVVAKNDRGYIDTGIFKPSAFALGLGYANALTDRFTVGGQIKYVEQNLGRPFVPVSSTDTSQVEFKKGVLAFDFGTIYRTGYKSLAFGMTVRNFSQEIQYEREGFQLPLTFKIGFSIDALDFFSESHPSHKLRISFDAVHPRSFPEFLNFGGEYNFLDAFILRLGYVTTQDEYGMNAGFGVQQYGVSIDYAYTPFDVFEDIHRVSFGFKF